MLPQIRQLPFAAPLKLGCNWLSLIHCSPSCSNRPKHLVWLLASVNSKLVTCIYLYMFLASCNSSTKQSANPPFLRSPTFTFKVMGSSLRRGCGEYLLYMGWNKESVQTEQHWKGYDPLIWSRSRVRHCLYHCLFVHPNPQLIPSKIIGVASFVFPFHSCGGSEGKFKQPQPVWN
jgi:hypothetical protein